MPLIQKDLRSNRGQIEFELDQDEYAAIGRVMVQWAYLEQGFYEMSVAISEAAGVALPAGANSVSFSERRKALLGLVRSHFETEAQQRFERLLGRVANVEAHRNKVAHGTWEWGRDNPEELTASLQRPKKKFEQNYDAGKIHGIADEIARISFDFQYPGGWEEAFHDMLTSGNPTSETVAFCSTMRHHVRQKANRSE